MKETYKPRPIIRAEKELFNKIIEVLSILILLYLFLSPFFYWSDLPEEIPIHFDIRGEADFYGHKRSLIIFSIIGLFLYSLITYINTIPHHFNYFVKITNENAAFQYRNMIRMNQYLKIICLLLIAYIMYSIYQASFVKPFELKSYILIIFLLSISTTICLFLFKAKNHEKNLNDRKQNKSKQ